MLNYQVYPEVWGVLLKTSSFIEDPHRRLVEDPQIFVGDPRFLLETNHIFVGNCQILIGDPQIFIGDLIFSLETPDFRWRPQYFHWRPPDFIGDLIFSLETPIFSLDTPII